MERYLVYKKSLEAFSGDYVWSCRDQYIGQYSEITLKEIIDNNIEFKKRNVGEKYFKFFN